MQHVVASGVGQNEDVACHETPFVTPVSSECCVRHAMRLASVGGWLEVLSHVLVVFLVCKELVPLMVQSFQQPSWQIQPLKKDHVPIHQHTLFYLDEQISYWLALLHLRVKPKNPFFC